MVGGAAGMDGPMAIGVVAVLVAELAAAPTQVTASTSTAAPPRSANPLLASDIIKSLLSSRTQWHTALSRTQALIDFVLLTVLAETPEHISYDEEKIR